MYCNSCINPFIYNHASKDFRDGFSDVLSRWGLNASSSAFPTSGQTGSRPAADTSDIAGQPLRADVEYANDEGDNHDAEENELTVGGVYCGPYMGHTERQLTPLRERATYV